MFIFGRRRVHALRKLESKREMLTVRLVEAVGGYLELYGGTPPTCLTHLLQVTDREVMQTLLDELGQVNLEMERLR